MPRGLVAILMGMLMDCNIFYFFLGYYFAISWATIFVPRSRGTNIVPVVSYSKSLDMVIYFLLYGLR